CHAFLEVRSVEGVFGHTPRFEPQREFDLVFGYERAEAGVVFGQAVLEHASARLDLSRIVGAARATATFTQHALRQRGPARQVAITAATGVVGGAHGHL